MVRRWPGVLNEGFDIPIAGSGRRVGVQSLEKAVFPEQISAGVVLDDTSVIEHHDVIRIPDGGHAMGDNDGGSALPERLKRIVNQIIKNAKAKA